MPENEITAGLRVDVDTLRGTRQGVPNLLELFDRYDIRATFFFSVGPDNMGRHLKRLLNPLFLAKMLRTRAPSLYGWDILLNGTFRPGPIIGRVAAEQIRAVAATNHEIGLHAWDHHQWQCHIDKMSANEIQSTTDKGISFLEEITGRPVDCMAAPAWKITPAALHDREKRCLRYCSDCRGNSIFYPLVEGKPTTLPQIPTTLPTFDELIGRKNITRANYNRAIMDHFGQGKLNVLTIHAEAEGIACLGLFQDFLEKARACRLSFHPLGNLLNDYPIGVSPIADKKLAGRQGWTSFQKERHDQ